MQENVRTHSVNVGSALVAGPLFNQAIVRRRAAADGSGIGTHRHEVGGPSDPQVPVLAVRDAGNGAFLAVMLVCSMHPTVLHEDSTLVSGDFPAMTRRWLQRHVVGENCPVLHHTGPCGNQSPRHVAAANTFEEATRLGELLGRSVAEAIASIDYTAEITLDCASAMVQLPVRRQPLPGEAQAAWAPKPRPPAAAAWATTL